MRVRIVHKGIAFLLVPLLVQFFFFFQMQQLSKRSEQLASKEETITTKIAFLNHVSAELFDGSIIVGGYLFRHDNTQIFAGYVERLRQLAVEARRIFPADQVSSQLANNLQQLLDDEYKEVLELTTTKESVDRDSILQLKNFVVKARRSAVRISSKYHEIANQIESERLDLEATRRQERRNREQIDNQVFAFMILDVVMAFALLAVFLQGITNRLSILVKNAETIPKGQPMTLKVTGQDELAYLDQVMHDVSQQLKVAAEYRNTLMNMLAHDLRGPLSAAQLSLKSLLRENSGPDKSEETRLRSASQNINRTISLVEDLLTIDKLEAGRLELQRDLIEARRFIDESFQAIESLAAAKNIVLSNQVASDVIIDADRLRMMQVMQNLLTNAIKHSSEHGTIAVTTEQSPGKINLRISDEGTGISVGEADKLFDKFYQADSTKGGFGLGLAITKMIVEAHGGRCGAQANADRGSTFWFSLPDDRLVDDE